MSMTPKRLDKYELLERLGHGGVAEVWKALDVKLQRFVALKLLKPDLREDPNFITRFQREAQLIASLHHPNIVQIHDFQVFQPSDNSGSLPIAYMVMDYIEGQTLALYIHQTSRQGQIPSPTEIINLFTSISMAIDYAHQHGMLHRDIKPANILLDNHNTVHNPMGEPILTDFGVAKLLSTTTNTLSGALLGTPLYISPEQASGYQGNERSDLYSLGVILYEIVTGVTPFRGDTPLDVITQHINATPTRPSLLNPQIPPALEMVIMRSLAKNPDARFASASSMTAAIAEAFEQAVPAVLGTPTFPPDLEDMPTHLTPLPPTSLPSPTPIPATAGTSGQGALAPGNQGPISQPGITPNATPNFTPVMIYAPPTPAQPPPTRQAPPHGPPNGPTPVPPHYLQAGGGRRGKRLYLFLIPLLIIVLIGSALGAYLLLFPQLFAAPSPIVGHAFYVSSGQLNPGSAQGIADQLQLDLENVPAPQAGKSYYVWLLGDRNPEKNPDLIGPRPIKPPLLLTNNLVVRNGSVHYTFPGDAQHNNLISATSRLLITEQNAGDRPGAPPTDRSTWRYYAELPQAQIPGDNPGFSALVHIRHLFYNETNIEVLGLPGGLDIWLFRNTEKVLEYAVSARDDWHGQNTSTSDIQLMNAQFIRILDYLDGAPNVHIDVPADTPLIADQLASKVALLTVSPQGQVPTNYAKDPPGYVDHVQLHVGQVAKATDITPDTLRLTSRILDAVNRSKGWLTNVRKDALALFQLRNNPTQMGQDSTRQLLDDLVTQATYAYIGQLDPTTNQVQAGVLQAHYDIQQLATLTITRNLPKTI
ncbi:serine/threonine protein kinase [Ktedonosporobacter rubrisoli]|uniref:non-specific serine/threonine protein kinase n=1 Tax=Ktedonosporobacter rubrisoli TaxID=2509675 RepID=A0A4P6JUF7_KTERU|nr:serine/threonine-protein kinase [Ktedonosporobacter rubrisoli]QBD79267.1 serine/threonine protein kinase [Ktedonosporobacter rubrisoli]